METVHKLVLLFPTVEQIILIPFNTRTKNLFIPSGTKSWNGLPMEDRSIGSLDAFKIKLRKAN